MDFYTVTTPPAELPVTRDEVKAYMKVTMTQDDTLIDSLIQAATTELENYTNIDFVQRTYLGEYDLEEFSKFELYGFAEIRRSPLKALTSVEVIQGGSGVTVTGTILKDNHSYARVLFSDPFPNMDDDVSRPLQIVFDAGYGSATDVPEPIKLAIMKLVNFHYRNRGDCAAQCEGPGTIKKSLANAGYKIIGTFG